MAICEFCNQDMLAAAGCIKVPVGATEPIRHGEETRNRKPRPRCHDCNAALGQYHHPGCDAEECPVCHGQACHLGIRSHGCLTSTSHYTEIVQWISGFLTATVRSPRNYSRIQLLAKLAQVLNVIGWAEGCPNEIPSDKYPKPRKRKHHKAPQIANQLQPIPRFEMNP
jgi:hypothetical protein